MIVPDLTLVLQIIHFGIAYVIMQKFIFAPALKIIQAQDHYQKSLEQQIDQARALQMHTQEEQQSRWQKMKNALRATTPKISQICLTRKKELEQPLPDQQELVSAEKQSFIKILCDQLSDIPS